MTIAVVVAHFKENLSWTKKIKSEYNLFIYSKTETCYNFIPVNRGHEATCYLKYIIDNYNNLHDKNLFFHGHENSDHQDNTSIFIANNLNWSLADYFSVNKRDWYFKEGINNIHHADNYYFIKHFWNSIFKDDINLTLPESLHHYSCAQFQVSKSLILRNSLSFYQNAYNWLINTDVTSYWSGRIFEHTWHYIFTHNPVELQQTSIYNIP